MKLLVHHIIMFICYILPTGWWLSMKKEDSFLNRLQPLEDFPLLYENKERFGKHNDKTLGFLLVSSKQDLTGT